MASGESRSYQERAPRAPLDYPVLCEVDGSGERFVAKCLNLSTSGMFLTCDSLPAAGTQFSFRFEYNGLVVLQGEARVARVDPRQPGIGVVFVSLDERSRRLMDRVVTLNLGDEEPPPAEAEPAAADAIRLLNVD